MTPGLFIPDELGILRVERQTTDIYSDLLTVDRGFICSFVLGWALHTSGLVWFEVAQVTQKF